MTSKELAEIEGLARATRPKIGSALYGQILALTAYVRRLEAIEAAARELKAADDVFLAPEDMTLEDDVRALNAFHAAEDKLYALLGARKNG